MTDDLILRLIDETCKGLARMEFFTPCAHLIPSYNALVRAVQGNHPDDPYLNTVFPILQPNENAERPDKHGSDGSGINPPLLRILFTQLRIILESLQEGQTSPSSLPTESRRREEVDTYREMHRAEGKEPTREREREREREPVEE
jgi:hypothetical protein